MRLTIEIETKFTLFRAVHLKAFEGQVAEITMKDKTQYENHYIRNVEKTSGTVLLVDIHTQERVLVDLMEIKNVRIH